MKFRPSPRTLLWSNVVLFQAAWFAIVLGAAAGRPWIAPIVAGAVLIWHAYNARQPRRELALVGVAVAVGAVFETLMATLQVLEPASGVLVPGIAAYWLVCLWAVFSTTLNVSLRWLRNRPVVAAVFGAIGGPLAYVGGSKLGALHLEATYPTIGALGVGWALATPLLLAAARRLDGYEGT